MAVPKPNVNWIPAALGNFKVGRSKAIDQITFHHIVGDAPAAIARFRKQGEEVSSTYVIGADGTIYQMVLESNTPYTDTNYDSNSRAITIEHAGGPPYSSVPYSEAMYASTIHLCAWIMERYGIGRFMRHRDVSLRGTVCPGNLDVERIVRETRATIERYNKPQPPPPPPVPSIKYVRYGQPIDYKALKQPTHLWFFNVGSWGEFRSVGTKNAGDIITIVGEAQHPLGGVYLMTEYSFGNANEDGTPNFPHGFNRADMEPAPLPPPPPPPEQPQPPPAPPPVEMIEKIEFQPAKKFKTKIATKLLNIPDGAPFNDKIFEVGQVMEDIAEYTRWNNGNKFYRTTYSVTKGFMRGFNADHLEEVVPPPPPLPERPSDEEIKGALGLISQLLAKIAEIINNLLSKFK